MNICDGIIQDEDLGTIRFHTNARARRIIFRLKDDYLEMTLPIGLSQRNLGEVINEMRPRLMNLIEKRKREEDTLIQPGYSLERPYFKLLIKTYQGERNIYVSSSKENGIILLCPEATKFNDENVQTFLKRIIVELMVKKAERVFPPILNELSDTCNLSYNRLNVSKAQTRWGSCSVYKHISLSCYLLLLPEYLMRSVMIHELCHTKEMNHGPKFWALMDRYTGNKALKFRGEIKKYKCKL